MNEELDPESPGMMPPGKLARSFMVVAGCYLLFVVSLFASFIAVTRIFFPEIFATLQNEDLIREVMEHSPETVLTRELFWTWLAANSVLCFFIGWLLAKLAPFGKFGHAVFLAMLVFVSGLQQAIGAHQSLQWMFVLLMAVLPIAVLFGARLAIIRKKGV